MKTQCPICKEEQEIPKEYEGREIKCVGCSGRFLALKIIPLAIKNNQKTISVPPPKLNSGPIKCPRCGSLQITANKKGFSGGKAVGGAILLGPLGLLVGLHRSKEIIITCLNCGHTWEPPKPS